MVKKTGYPKQTPLLAQTKRLLREAGLRARKGLGQHYLIDGGVLKLILSAAELAPDDIVIEVGPGLGVLTRELVKKAGWVVAIELDDKLAALLKETLADFNNFTIVNEDVLKVDPAALLEELKEKLPSSMTNPLSYKVVANLPYYITSPVLRHFLEARVKPKAMVVMVQKEVAKAIVAEPGDMSILSVSVQLYGKPRIMGNVPGRSFYPAPKVDSVILRIDLYSKPAVDAETESFFKLVRAGFAAARKQIANSLAQGLGLPKADVLAMLEKASIDSQRRAETLTLEEWGRLWREFAKVK